MKIQDLTLGSSAVIMRDFKDIHQETRKFFREQIPSLSVPEKLLEKTPFFLSVKELEGLPLFELYHTESLCFVSLCACEASHRQPAIDYMRELAKTLKLEDRFQEPKGNQFLFTVSVNPLLPYDIKMLAGEIGFYIYHRIFELYKKEHESRN